MRIIYSMQCYIGLLFSLCTCLVPEIGLFECYLCDIAFVLSCLYFIFNSASSIEPYQNCDSKTKLWEVCNAAPLSHTLHDRLLVNRELHHWKNHTLEVYKRQKSMLGSVCSLFWIADTCWSDAVLVIIIDILRWSSKYWRVNTVEVRFEATIVYYKWTIQSHHRPTTLHLPQLYIMNCFYYFIAMHEPGIKCHWIKTNKQINILMNIALYKFIQKWCTIVLDEMYFFQTL